MISTLIPLGPLDEIAFEAWGAPITYGEVAAFVTGALCVWLVAHQHIANWSIGMANAAFFSVLFANFGLYADSVLQLAYIGLGAYGWWAWRNGRTDTEEMPVTRTDAGQWVVLLGAMAAGTAAMWAILAHATDSTVPGWDAVTTALSLGATWGQTRKKLESWWLWITADVIYIPLYAYKDLWLTSLLYVFFLTLCLIGLRDWRRSWASREEVTPMLAPAAVTAT